MRQYDHADELYHYGVKGMKWGVRRYQNEDGTLTDEGKKHYADLVTSAAKSGKLIDMSKDYISNETPLMREKRRELFRLSKREDSIQNKLDRDLDNMEAEAVRKYTADDKIDKEWGAQYNARMKEIKATAKAELKSVREEQQRLVKEWTNEFLGKYANQRTSVVVKGKSFTINAGKEFAHMFELAAWDFYR